MAVGFKTLNLRIWDIRRGIFLIGIIDGEKQREEKQFTQLLDGLVPKINVLVSSSHLIGGIVVNNVQFRTIF